MSRAALMSPEGQMTINDSRRRNIARSANVVRRINVTQGVAKAGLAKTANDRGIGL